MTKYNELIQQIKQTDINKAEQWEEEIDIIIHKLKFLPQESFPNVIVLSQKDEFKPIYDNILVEKVKIAGGILVENMDQKPSVLIVIQEDQSLYNQIGEIIKSPEHLFVQENKIFIIQTPSYNLEDEEYIRDTEILAEIIQPKYFYFDREGKDWVKFDV